MATRFRRADGVLDRRVGRDVIASAPAGGPLHLLEGTASDVWELLDAPRSVREVAEALGARYGETPRRLAPDVASLLQDLAGRGLLDSTEDAHDRRARSG